MVNRVEELGQVQVNHVPVSLGHVGLGESDRILGAPAGSEPVAEVAECRFEHRSQYLHKGLLDYPVYCRRYPKQTHPSVVLGYFPSEHRFGFIRPSDNLLANQGPVGFKVGWEFCHFHPVDSCRTLVLHHLPHRLLDVRKGNQLFTQSRVRS